ncbi:hypothetical protein [Streptomyces sp. PA03-2a]|uniref:hypothetical protein n=1 Tax=Streptomyces sp. PA03-2a TaxID=3028701 RepID=UPI0029A090EB|nr:hypothetical protein [Streptomyces sp. PA03-2a]MDX2731480.1 hypothetical protein [Streptomyces sp. PA03-2a]
MTRSARTLSRRARRRAASASAALAALLLATPAAAHAVPLQATGAHTVAFAVKPGSGVPIATVTVFNRTTWQAYELGGNTRTTLAPGSYVAVATAATGSAGYLIVRTFNVSTAAQTVTFDPSAAKNVVLHTDDTAAERTGIRATLGTGSSGTVSAPVARDLRVTPFSVPGLSLAVHEMQQRVGSSQASPTPYVYDLEHVWKDTLPSTTTLKWNRTQLGAESVVVHGPGTRAPTLLNSTSWAPDQLSAPVTGAGKFTWYASPKAHLIGRLESGTGGYALGYYDNPVGRTETLTVGTAPVQPSRGYTTLSGNVLTSDENLPGDQTGAYQSDFAQLSESTVLTQGDRTWTAGDRQRLTTEELPNGPQEFTLVHTMVATSASYRLSTRTQDVWRFRADPSGSSAAPLIDPVLAASGLDAFGHVGTGPVTLSVSATSRLGSTAGAVTVTGIAWSADDGAHWADLPVTAGPRTGTATARLTAPATTPWVSLRVTATDALGNTVTRTLTRAFGGPAAAPEGHTGALAISNVNIENVALVATGNQELTADYTLTDPSGTAAADLVLYHGSYDRPTGMLIEPSRPVCTPLSAKAQRCTATLSTQDLLRLGAANAGTWHLAVVADSATGHVEDHDVATVTLVRKAHLSTVDVTPEPVTKGGRITATGTLTRDDWDGTTPSGYAGRAVKLQFCKGTSPWTTVATGTTDAGGRVRIGAPAPSGNGRYRLAYTGDPGGPALSGTDGVTVR